MTRLLLLPALALTLLLTAAIGLIHARPYHDDSDLRVALTPPESCAPCFMGIRIRSMTTDQVIEWLEGHPWVQKVILSERSGSIWGGTIGWEWSGQQPTWIDPTRDGSVWTQGHIARFVRFQTTISFGDLWLAFDHPPKGSLRVESDAAGTKRIIQYAAYPGQDFVAGFTLPCPFRPADFWHQPVQIQFYDGMGDFNQYDLRGWISRLSC